MAMKKVRFKFLLDFWCQGRQ